MRTGRWRRGVPGAIASLVCVVAWSGGPAVADEPPAPTDPPPASPVDTAPTTVAPEPVRVGELDGVAVALTEALPLPSLPPVATVAAPAERVAVGIVDGVEVGLIEPPIPVAPVAAPPVRLAAAAAAPPTATPADVPPTTNSAAPVAHAPVESVDVTIDLVLSAWG